MTRRQPFPWEQVEPEPSSAPVDPMSFLAVPELPEPTEEGQTVCTYVEAAVGTAMRGRDGLERRLREHGYSPEYSREQATAAARRIDGKTVGKK